MEELRLEPVTLQLGPCVEPPSGIQRLVASINITNTTTAAHHTHHELACSIRCFVTGFVYSLEIEI